MLLATLPDVLWEGHGVERVGIDKLMEPNAVRTAYRKYIAKFHPDKVHNEDDADKSYVATAVFAAVNEQYDAFKKEHNLK